MNVTRVSFEKVEPGSGFAFAAIIEGEGVEARAMPIVVKCGDIAARYVVELPSGNGVRATFTQTPAIGTELEVGYLDEGITGTGFLFETPTEPIG